MQNTTIIHIYLFKLCMLSQINKQLVYTGPAALQYLSAFEKTTIYTSDVQ